MSELDRLKVELSRRVLQSECSRAQILAWTLSGLGLGFLYFMWVASRHTEPEMATVMPGMKYVLLLCILWAGFEWWTAWQLRKAIREGHEPHRLRFYLNAMVEIAVPMWTVFIAANGMSPIVPINGPFIYSFFLFIILSPMRLDVALCLFTGFITAGAYLLLVLVHWNRLAADWVGLPFWMHFSFGARTAMFAMGGIAAAFVTQRIRAMLFETVNQWAEQERIIGLFGQHVSPAVVNQLLSQSADFTETRSVCVLVFDIRNFTTFSEQRSADDVVNYLNTLWGHLVRIVNEHDGSVNKFLGDGFLAVFGAPVALGNNARQAMAAARKLLAEITTLVEEKRLPPTEFGIALHAGDVIAGTVGSSQRKEYTVIGDVVNVAFRIEALNKDFGSKLLVSDVVAQAAGLEGLEPLPPIRVKGREQPIALYRVA